MDASTPLTWIAITSLLLLPVIPAAGAHITHCSDEEVDFDILLPQHAHDTGSVSEYAHLVVLRQAPVQDQALNTSTNEIDGFVYDLHCQSFSGSSWQVIVDDDLGQLGPVPVMVREYDRYGEELDETGCATSHTMMTTDPGTQYFAVVPCEGAPLTVVNGPSLATVEGTLNVWA